jgi:hypothetical protein
VVGHNLGISPQSVANWVNSHAASLHAALQLTEIETVELDELFNFIGEKKQSRHPDSS